MIHPRRNHGCSIVTYQGRKGFLVAGGYNSKEYFLKAVEFLPLELGVGSWESLPAMQQYRGSRMGVLSIGLTIYVVSGDLEGNGTLIETLSGYQTKWTTLGTRLLREKSYATFLPV
ncbi:uncharacterized protein LOC111717908 [Eurytemora carolleeae]|uniref:uncharacterized protein LOC111717908 n=1 Tax=Eurytemora carolleeae TaxID=1294199 RepID=UPI000C7568B8|nr:uncharacterized protein LOC111717908 [Eurytemora carolleeae]|eukprot:XP_023349137.1 uncharacterized protein LOC111717908 [Eurytemora affinis]